MRANPVHDPLADIVRRAGAGDTDAANALVRALLPRVYRVAARILHDPTEAEDVAQEAFLRAWKVAANWKPGAAKFETWVHRITLNLCFDRLRRRKRIASEDSAPEQIDDSPSASDGMFALERAKRVKQAMDALPERQRTALVLCHFEDMGNIEAAGALEISVEALESLLSRGRKALRTALIGEAEHWISGLGEGG